MESAYWEETDDLELIKLVEVNCCLYNKKLREFKTVDKREVWYQIGVSLTNKKTGDQAQKRWDSLRAMWSRQHKKYHEQGRSGSGASQDTQEFQYYGEMSFLIPHYSSRQTKSNMKRSASSISSDGSSGSQFNINKPLLTDSPCVIIQDSDCDIAQSETDIYDNTSLNSGEILQQSSQEKYETHQFHAEDRVPFSPMAHAALNEMSSKRSLCNKTCTKEKYKLKENIDIKVPEPDKFCKKKKVELDNYMRSSAQSLQKMVEDVGHIISQKNEQKIHDSDSDNVDKDISDMLKCAYIGLKQVRPNMRFNCVVEILTIINRYKEQGLEDND